MIKYLILMLAIMYIGCSETYIKDVVREQTNKIIYFQDKKTGICYAEFTNATSLTCVPCEKIPDSLLVK